MTDVPVQLILALVLLLLLSGISAIVFSRLRFPYTVGLVAVGLGLGALASRVDCMSFVARLHFTPNVVLDVLLPALVFEAALNMDTRRLFRDLVPILLLAAPGLVFAAVVTGFLVHGMTPLSLGAAMLFGALISTTDPVAVIAIFKELGAPRRLAMLVDGESLLNDATAIVAFNLVLGLLSGGSGPDSASLARAAVEFAAVFLGGAVVGAAVGLALARLLSLARNDPLVDTAFTVVVAYSSFILAQFYLGLSGVMAVVGAGLAVAHYGSTRFSPEARAQLGHFWSFACFSANSYVFLLLGLTEGYLARRLDRLPQIGLFVLVAVFAVQISRALLVFGAVPLFNRFSKHPIGRAYRAVLFWGGLRGALPVALAMSLSPEQVGGEANFVAILDCTLGVVLFSLLVQGTSMRRLMDRLGVGPDSASAVPESPR